LLKCGIPQIIFMKKNSFFFLILFALDFCDAQAQMVPIITTIAGNSIKGYGGDGGPATSAQLKYVGAVAVDDSGNLFIADANYVIRKVNSSGIITTFAGSGMAGYSGDGGLATAAKIGGVGGIACDSKGNVYFSGGNNNIRKVDKSGIITSIAGNGMTVTSGDDGLATAAGIPAPYGICLDKFGNIYIGSNYRIRKIDISGIISTYAGTGVAGYSGDGGTATAAKIYATQQISADVSGNLYFVDFYRIRKIDNKGVITTIAGNNSAGNSGDGGPATAAQLNPRGVFADKCGNIYIADSYNNEVRMINTNGIISTVAGDGLTGYSGDGGPATLAKLNIPENIYLDSNSNIYIADDGNNVVRYIRMDSCIVAPIKTSVSIQMRQFLHVYPNPATDELNVTGVQQAAKYNLYNVTGTSVLTGALQEGSNVLSIRYLAPGVYILEMVDDSGERKMVRVVKE
jgi:type IX secretion system substrate protein